VVDFDLTKVLCAFGANVAGYYAFGPQFLAVIATWFSSVDSWAKLVLTFAQLGVAVATIIYVSYKARNEKRKLPPPDAELD
jgi:hypothetical protein